MDKEDGGQAFPGPSGEGVFPCHQPGMTLRDWFAGQALVGILANSVGDEKQIPLFAEIAYTQADAMLKAAR